MIRLHTLERFEGQPLTTQLLLGVLQGYKRPYDKIVEWVEKGYLIQVRRGLYVPAEASGILPPEPFLVANHLYGPSYISMESALSHWGLIPERVYQICSATNRISKNFNAGGLTYSFTHLPMPYYAFGIRQVELTATQTVLMASPEKCLCDKIITTAGVQLRSKRQAMEFLVEDLRIDEDDLRNLDAAEITGWLGDSPKMVTLSNLITAIKSLQ